MRWRLYNAVAAVVLMLTLGAIAAYNYAVDPLYFYRYPSPYGRGYCPRDRLLMAGLAAHAPAPGIVIGSSYSQNFKPSEFERALGMPFINLAVAGATAREQRYVVEAALHHRPIQHVVWEVALSHFTGPPERMNTAAYFPISWYERTPLSHARYLLSAQTFAIARRFVAGKFSSDIDAYNHWQQHFPLGREHVIRDWCRRGYGDNAGIDSTTREAQADLRATVQANLLAVVRAHPDVEFSLMLPPFSYASYHLLDRKLVLLLRQLLATAAIDLPNLQVYDFQIERDIVMGLDHYKDAMHFGAAVSAHMVSALAAGAERLTRANQAERDAELQAIMATPLGFTCAPPTR